LDGLLPLAAENLFGHVSALNALDLRLRAAEIVVAGAGAQADDLLSAALKLPHVERVVQRARRADELATHPARDMLAAAPPGTAVVCMGSRCSLPLADPRRLADVVAEMRGAGLSGSEPRAG
ncbi:MAG TPA: thioredoxin domain-containing protein, partial [Xanthobacteraceae bacterium]